MNFPSGVQKKVQGEGFSPTFLKKTWTKKQGDMRSLRSLSLHTRLRLVLKKPGAGGGILTHLFEKNVDEKPCDIHLASLVQSHNSLTTFAQKKVQGEGFEPTNH